MRTQKPSPVTAWLTSLCLVASLVTGIMVSSSTHAKTSNPRKDVPHAKFASDLREKAHGARSADLVRVILQLKGSMSGPLNAFLNQGGVHGSKKFFNNLNAHVIEIPASWVDALSAFDEVAYISLDRPTQSMGHLSLTTGADIVRGQGWGNPGLDGSGIGIAVLDSGVYRQH